MKPLGVRLAAGAITILLGALAAAQAQKDRQKAPSSPWTVADAAVLSTPPAPIAAMGTDSWNLDASVSDQNFAPAMTPGAKPTQKFPAGPLDTVQLVQHTEPVASPDSGPMDFAPPPGMNGFDPGSLPQFPGASDQPTEDAAPAWGMPAFGSDADSSPAPQAPAMTMALPTLNDVQPLPDSAPSPEQAPQPKQTTEIKTGGPPAMPELQFEGPPGFGAPAETEGNHDYAQQEQFNLQPSAPGMNSLRGNEPTEMLPPNSPPPVVASVPSANAFAAPPANTYGAASSIQPAPMQAAPMQIANLPTALQPSYEAAPLQPQRQPLIETRPGATINTPGDRRLEGVQTPSIVIHKRAPNEVKVGKPAAFVIYVQNVGSVEALDVQVHDRVPAGMRLVDASPAPTIQGDTLSWQLGSLPAGDERTVTLQLVAEEEGELGSVARVTFEAAASVRTISTRPQLNIVQRAPEKVHIGQQLEIELEVSNPGTGDALGVILQEDVPDGLEHAKGRQLDNLIGTLRAGEVRRQMLRLRAVAPGKIQNLVRLTSEEGLTAEHMVEVEVIAPQLQLELAGPSRRFLERQATYQLDLSNVGTAEATNVEIAAYLDRGFTFVGTDHEGQYDPTRHAVYWSLPKLPEGGRGQVPLTLLPVEEGERTIRLEARGDLGLTAKSERNVTVESLAELTFQIADAADPIEIGSETTYEIRLTNRGSRSDSNVQVKLQLPTGLELVSSEGDAGTDGRGLVQFAPQAKMDSGQELVYRIRVRGVAPGTHLTRAIVVSDQSQVPVTKEESTMVYADQ